MFRQVVQASEGMQEAARQGRSVLVPALLECRNCRTTRMIAAPALGVCERCGAALTVLDGAEPQDAAMPEPPSALAA